MSAIAGAATDEGLSFGSHSPNPDRLLTASELAERWQVQKAQVYRLTREGKVPTVKIGRYFRYRVSAIDAFEAAGGAAADV